MTVTPTLDDCTLLYLPLGFLFLILEVFAPNSRTHKLPIPFVVEIIRYQVCYRESKRSGDLLPDLLVVR
jgi:hypothetical protein